MFKSKIVVGITLFIYFVINTSILTAGLINRDKNLKEKNSPQTLGTAETDTSNPAEITILSSEIVSMHATQTDCWLIIEGNVYDVSSFLNLHPGGAGEITSRCGTDTSQAFATKGKIPGIIHSTIAKKMLNDYFIGKLGDSIAVINPNSTNRFPTQSNNPIKLSNNTGAQPTIPPQLGISTSSVTLTASEVAKHATASDCWMIVSGLVYNLSGYASQHPGGSIMIPYCGKDGTTAFQTQGGQGSHSGTANNILSGFLLGPLNSVTQQASTGSTTPSSGTTTGTGTVTQNTTNTVSAGLPPQILSKYPNAIYVSGKYEDDGGWEGKINVSGVCKAVKVGSSGTIKEENC